MKNIKRQFAEAIGILAIYCLSLNLTLADSIRVTRDAGGLGCILRQSGSAKFMRADRRDKKAIGDAVLSAHRLRGGKVIDPCLTGQLQDLSATIYASLAEKHPENFQPLEVRDQSAVPLTTAPASEAPNTAPGYHYVSLDEEVPLPPGFLLFDPAAITNGNRIYGNAYTLSGETLIPHVAVFERGNLNIFQEGFATTVNQGGMVGGYILTDPENFFGQAALFRGNAVQLIPRLPREIHSEVVQINDAATALIFSVDENFIGTLALYERGRVTPLDFGPDIPFAFFFRINNEGIISGTTFIDGLGYRGFRFNPRTGLATVLEPLPTESHAWALDINNRGDILGYSFEFSATERIGVWDRNGKFHTYFVEGTPEFPTISNNLEFNDNNQIVITRVESPASEMFNSYLVPKPGERLNLADLVVDMPPEHGSLWLVRAINNHGDMFGFTLRPDFFSNTFLLERKGGGSEKNNP